MANPVSPTEVIEAKLKYIPDEVIEAFNELIAKKFDGNQVIIKQKEAVNLILRKLMTVNPDDNPKNSHI